MGKRLFLDDIRIPKDVYFYTYYTAFNTETWDIVRNYDEFVEYITQNGLPDYISFDHDLADSHYTPSEFWDDYYKSKEWQEKQVYKEKTGYDCAKWLIDYCLDNNLKLPEYYCHSMNPVGKDKILSILKSYEKWKE